MPEVGYRTAPVKQERAKATEESILNALEELLREGIDFDDVKIEDIVKRAGCSNGSFYHRFPTKTAALLQLSSERINRDALQAVADTLDFERCEEKNLLEVIFDYLMATNQMYRESAHFQRFVFMERRFKTVPKAFKKQVHHSIAGVSERLQARVLERMPNVNHLEVSRLIRICGTTFTMVIRDRVLINETFVGIGEPTDEEFIRDLARMFVRSLNIGAENAFEAPEFSSATAESN